MKTIVTAHDTYEFNELTEDMQETVLNNLYDINTDYDWWDCELEYWHEELEKIGFHNAKIYFSGFYSQGDGACFDADIEVNERVFDCFVESLNNKQNRNLFDMLLKHGDWFYDYLYNSCEFSIERTPFANHYNHERTREVTGYINQDTVTPGYLEQCFDLFVDYLEEKRRDLCRAIFLALRQEYDYLTARKTIVESITCNGYTFLADGKIFNNLYTGKE